MSSKVLEVIKCSKCGKFKSINEFSFRTDTQKYRSQCKECRNKYFKQYNKQRITDNPDYNKERYIKEKDIRHERSCEYYKNNKEICKVENRKNYVKNKDLRCEWQRNYYKTHLKSVKAYNKQYRINNKDKLYEATKEWIKNNRKKYNEGKREYNRNWYRNNLDKVAAKHSKFRGYGFKHINNYFYGCNGHHLHLENTSAFVIYMPNFLHIMHQHKNTDTDSMITPNAIALDFWINEDFYYRLYKIELPSDLNEQKR